MFTRASVKTPKRQRGLALLILVIVIVLAVISYSLSTLSYNQVKTEQVKKTRASLKKAKQALLAYAMNYPDMDGVAASQGPGNLPCPAELDGVRKLIGGIGAGPSCQSPVAGALGYFPWKTLETGMLHDGSGELLWYAVSNNYAAIAGNEINSTTIGQIATKNWDGSVLNNSNTNDAIVAVIISPGEALVRDDNVVQSRTTLAEKLDATNYLDIAYAGNVLEEDNADYVHSDPGNNGFIFGPVYNVANQIIVNDHIEVITYNEIMNLVQARVGEDISNLINTYLLRCDAYPEASEFDTTKVSFDSAGFAPPVGSELRQGHLPLGIARPVDWGGVCAAGLAPVPPLWLAAERWDETTYYTFAYQNAPPANGLTCGNGANPPCMIVNNTNPPINNAQALIVFVGRELPAQDRVTVPVLASDFLEGENAIDNGTFDADEADDFVRVITP